MARVREGAKGALVVVDVQVGVLEGAWEADRVVGNVALAVERARTAGVPVVWVQHEDEELARDTPAWAWAPQLAPTDDEVRIAKSYNSCFEQTPLEDQLAGLGVSHLALAGAATNWCIRATAYAALERGYDVTLVTDAHTTVDDHAREVVEDLNTVLTWVSYADVTSTTASCRELDFAQLA